MIRHQLHRRRQHHLILFIIFMPRGILGLFEMRSRLPRSIPAPAE